VYIHTQAQVTSNLCIKRVREGEKWAKVGESGWEWKGAHAYIIHFIATFFLPAHLDNFRSRASIFLHFSTDFHGTVVAPHRGLMWP